MVGLLSLCASTIFDADILTNHPRLMELIKLFSERHPEVLAQVAPTPDGYIGYGGRRLLSPLSKKRLERILSYRAAGNDQLYDMIVSTNYINRVGYNPGLGANGDTFTNVNFEFRVGERRFKQRQNDLLRVLTNLAYNPRPPVFVTNRTTGVAEFRYYLDLNRNRRYDTNGLWPEIGFNGGFLHPDGSQNNNPVDGITNFYVGDPEWIGVLERPELPHSSSNRFVARYAYLVVPAGKTLDVNYIHNQVLNRTLTANDGYLRNQGLWTWEPKNLGAFLTDLNTNFWPGANNQYQYRQHLQPPLPNVAVGLRTPGR